MKHAKLDDMKHFVTVARCRNFGRAAAALGMPSSTLSSRIAALEESLGLRLLNRSTRKVELTEEGELYLSRIEPIVEEALRVHEDLRDLKSEPRGHLRVSIPHTLATDFGMTWLSEFTRTYPEITFEINTVPTYIDLIADRFDVAIRLDSLRDSHLYARRAGSFSRYLFASPSYLAQRGIPKHPHDLAGHECARLIRSPDRWTLRRGAEIVSVDVTGRYLLDSTVLARPLGLGGVAVIQLISQLAAAEEATGRLVKILPEWRTEAEPLYIVTPTRQIPRRTRLLVDFLAAKMREIADREY